MCSRRASQTGPGPRALSPARSLGPASDRAGPMGNALGRAGLFRDRRVTQGIGRKAAVLPLRSVEPSAGDKLLAVRGPTDADHSHPGTPGFQLHRIPDLEAHFRPRIASAY